MSALGNGSLSGSDFKDNNVLPVNSVTSTGGLSSNYNSKLVGGKKHRRASSSRSYRRSSLRSRRRSGLVNTLRLKGGKRKTYRSKK
jgi:hypothetical protein